MGDRQSQAALLMATVMIALIAIIVFIEPPEEEDETAEEWHELLPDTEAEDVTGLTLAHGGASLSLERRDDGWHLTAPITSAAEDRKVERLLETLTALEVGAVYADADPADFGLSPARVTAALHTRDGEAHTLEIGDDAPVGYQSYVRIDGGVKPARTRLAEAAALKLDDLRSRELVAFARTAVASVAIEGPDLLRVFSRDDHGWWTTVSGLRTRADADALDRLLAAVSELRVEEFGASLAPPGADALRLTLNDGTDRHILLLSPGEDGLRTVAGPLQDGPRLVRTHTLDEQLSQPTWTSPLLLPVRAVTLTDLTFSLGGVTLSATRDDSGWVPAAGESLLSAVKAARVDRTIAAPEPTVATGELRLQEADTRAEALTFHQTTPDGVVTTDAAGGPPFLLPVTEVTRLLTAARSPEGPSTTLGSSAAGSSAAGSSATVGSPADPGRP